MNRFEPGIALNPRTNDQNADLGLLIFREHLPSFLRIWTLCTLPACLLTYTLAYLTPQGLLLGLGVFLVASGPLALLTVATCFQLLKGESLELRAAWKALGPSPMLILLRVIGVRILQFLLMGCFLIPGLLLMNRDASYIEDLLFRREFALHGDLQLSGRTARQRVRMNQDASGVAIFWFALWFMVLISADFFCERLFGFSLLIKRVGFTTEYADWDGVLAALWSFVISDGVLSTALVGTGLLAYQVVRIGWFLDYCDDRIRRECFDVELRVRAEVDLLAPAND